MSCANVLLDTNVLIALEDPASRLSGKNAELLRLAQDRVKFFVHPLQYAELSKDENTLRKDKMLARIGRYGVLENPPSCSAEEMSNRGWSNSRSNDYIDNQLLYSVEKHAVQFFITEDHGIRRKANRSGLSERVMSLDEFHEYLFGYEDKTVQLAAVDEVYCYEIDEQDSLLDSLRLSYGADSFNTWWQKCAEEHRKAWAIRDSTGGIKAICVYNPESNEALTTKGLVSPGKTLKLCTIKVSPDARGSKIGERLLRIAFEYCRENGYEYTYFHTDEEEQSQLVTLAVDFGFQRLGEHVTSHGDIVYGKSFAPSGTDTSIPKAEFLNRFYPNYLDDSTVNKFLIPIQKKYHELLFPDVSDFRQTLFGEYPEMYSSESNTIRKVYITRSRVKQMEPGDLILFYRSHDRKSVDVLGAVVAVNHTNDVEEAFKIANRRTVYSMDEISDLMSRSKAGLSLITFDYLMGLESPYTLDELRKSGRSHPQKWERIDDSAYKRIVRRH